MNYRMLLLGSIVLGWCATAAAVTPEGIIYESERIAAPTSAWLKDRGTADHWNLWTKEEQIEKKRSGGAVLASPVVKADRNSPAEGAPPLHCVVRDLQPGWYQVFVSGPGRPLAYALDGEHWFRRQGGEFVIGLFHAGTRPFEMWVDDRYAGPANSPGPGYFDYLRFVPTVAPRIENLETYSPAPGVIVVCWTTNVPLANGQAIVEGAGRQQQSTPEEEPLRNHRAVLRGLDARQDYRTQVRYPSALCPLASETRLLRAAPQPAPTKPGLSIPLTVSEPGKNTRTAWPTTIGMPFAQGALAQAADLQLVTSAGKTVPLQAEAFSRWRDGSVKWAVLSFLADSAREPSVAYRLQSGQSAVSANLIQLTASAAGWTVRSPSVSLGVDRKSGSLFRGLTLLADAAEKPATRLTLVDGAGKLWGCGPPDASGLVAESNGPIRAVVKWSGPLVPEKGAAADPSEWGYLVRLTFWKGTPLVDLDVSLWRDAPAPEFAEVRAWTLHVPLAKSADHPTALPWAIQDHDNRCRSGDARKAGPEKQTEQGSGFVQVAGAKEALAVSLPNFWQNYPFGYRAQPDGVDVLLLPELPADSYLDQDGRNWYWRIYSWCREGKYVWRAGQLLRRQVRIWLGPAGNSPTLAEWLDRPLLPQAPCEYLAATGVWGSVTTPAAARAWPDYEAWFQRSFARLEKNCRDNRTFSFMHFGDWYGERGLNYGNNEYDLPWALSVQWMRTGTAAYFWRGLAMARHYSTIDTLHGRPAEHARGLCLEHSFDHVGTPFGPEQLCMTPDKPAVKQYLEQYGKGMFRGAIDPQGHVYQDGNWIAAALTGDAFLHDVAVRVCDHQAERLTRNFDFGIERCGGWPLINAVGAYRHSGDPYYLNAARIMIQRCLERQDPATGGWLHKPPLSETDGQPVLGGKAFAVGILTFGMLRYLESEPLDRPDVRRMLIRGADWLMNEAWNPQKKGFRYISNCEKYRNTGDKGLTALMTLELPAAAYQWTHDEKYRRFARELLEDAFKSDCGSMGKAFAQGTRQTIFGLERLRRVEQERGLPIEKRKEP